MERYEIYLNGALIDSVKLSGIAFIKFETACLLGVASLVRVVEAGDPVIDGNFEYNGGDWVYKGPIVPPCPSNNDRCKYRHPYEQPMLQKNALRVEFFTPSDRCGWNLKPNRVGGCPDDYYPCIGGGID